MPAPGERGDAAVAMLMAGEEAALEVCFIRRAVRPGDPWSGQVGFPGGRPDVADAHLRETAERETKEELGLGLGRAEHLGMLPPVPIHRGDGAVTPFVYYLGPGDTPLTPDPSEVDRAFWVPIRALVEAQRRTVHSWRGLDFPAIRVGDEDDVLWGLTLRVCEIWGQHVGLALGLDWPISVQAR